MHEVGFEPTNSKRQDLKSCAVDHFATHAFIFVCFHTYKSIILSLSYFCIILFFVFYF